MNSATLSALVFLAFLALLVHGASKVDLVLPADKLGVQTPDQGPNTNDLARW